MTFTCHSSDFRHVVVCHLADVALEIFAFFMILLIDNILRFLAKVA